MFKSTTKSFVFLFCAGALWCAGADVQLLSNDSVTFGLRGFGSLQNGEIVEGHYKEYSLSHLWLEKGYVNLSSDFVFHKNFSLSLGIEGKAWRDEAMQNYNTEWEVPQKYYTFYIAQADAEYTFQKWGPLAVTLGGGVFPYKYNPDVRNLGEFLFRSGTYPGWIINEFDMPFARLTGLKLGTVLFGCVSQDLLLTTETEMPPAYDFSLSYIGKYTFRNIFEIGWGVDFARIFPINANETTPRNWENVSEIKNGRPYIIYDSANYMYDTAIVGDTVFYTFTGIKPMLRFSFDPKPLLPKALKPFAYNDDGRIYAEAVILGVKNYVGDYDTLRQRIPVAFGVNWPTHQFTSYCLLPGLFGYLLEKNADKRLTTTGGFGAAGIAFGIGAWLLDRFFHINTRLDLLSFEGEWYGSPYPNSYQRIVYGGDRNPTRPLIDDPLMYLSDYSKDNWKWSVYAKKSFGAHFTMIAQAARDHIFTEQYFGDTQDREESLIKPGQWWWVLKLESNL